MKPLKQIVNVKKISCFWVDSHINQSQRFIGKFRKIVYIKYCIECWPDVESWIGAKWTEKNDQNFSTFHSQVYLGGRAVYEGDPGRVSGMNGRLVRFVLLVIRN